MDLLRLSVLPSRTSKENMGFCRLGRSVNILVKMVRGKCIVPAIRCTTYISFKMSQQNDESIIGFINNIEDWSEDSKCMRGSECQFT